MNFLAGHEDKKEELKKLREPSCYFVSFVLNSLGFATIYAFQPIASSEGTCG
jgi:hypothetical protein